MPTAGKTADYPFPCFSPYLTLQTRKVKCSGTRPSCEACQRSARFRGEDPDTIVCSYLKGRKCGQRGDGAEHAVERHPRPAKRAYKDNRDDLMDRLDRSRRLPLKHQRREFSESRLPRFRSTAADVIPARAVRNRRQSGRRLGDLGQADKARPPPPTPARQRPAHRVALTDWHFQCLLGQLAHARGVGLYSTNWPNGRSAAHDADDKRASAFPLPLCGSRL